MKTQPLLSIVIPSRNRQKYAISCIKSILSIDDVRLQVIVHDNSDTKELMDFIESSIEDNRLIYRYDNTPMSTVHNFNKAMDYVTGEYLCFIGDDDGVIPEIIEATAWAKNRNIDALVGRSRFDYLWPHEKRVGQLTIYPFSGRIFKVDVKEELEKFLMDGGVFYLNYDLPKVYHGIVKKECFDKVKKKIGYYFGGLSVDIFASISLSLVAESVMAIDYPLTIAGSSSASEQTHKTSESKKLALKDAPHFRERGKYNWSTQVPPVYSGITIWAESGIKALEAFGQVELLRKIDKYVLASHVVLDNSKHDKLVIKAFLNDDKFEYRNKNFILVKWFTKLTIINKRIVNRINKLINGKSIRKYYNIETIETAAVILQKQLKHSKTKISYN